MKNTFKVLTASVLLGFMSANTSYAGVKEAGGDSSVIFTCRSAPYVDSDLIVVGLENNIHGVTELVVIRNGQIVAQDIGDYSQPESRFVGQNFDLQFTEHGETLISAKVETPVLQAGLSDSLYCTWQ